jgi:GT2 family glycosyltransferase
MWDASWTPLEHPAFTDKPFIEKDTENWWSLRYLMNKAEQNQHNNIEEIDVTTIAPHKYNGCGLVISSEVVKAGVNIPKSVFFVHEDTAMMLMSQKLLGNIPQYHFRNILVVHNRKHPRKRCYILGEEGIDKTGTGELRKVHSWYEAANKFCEENCYNIFN